MCCYCALGPRGLALVIALLRLLLAFAGGSKPMGPTFKGVAASGLHPQSAFTTEPANKTFAREEQGLIAAHSAYFIVQAFFPGDNFIGIYHIFTIHIYRDGCAVGIEPKLARATALN